MNKDYTIKKFVEEYESKLNANDKNTFLKSKLKVDKYMSYANKLTLADKIVKDSSYAFLKNEEGKLYRTNKISINSPMRYILFTMSIIDKYTNLEVNFGDIMLEFDYLNRNNLFEIIFDKIGDKEISELNTIVEMVLNDFMDNEYQFKNFISDTVLKLNDVVQKFSPILNSFIEKIDNLSEEDANNLLDRLDKLKRFIK